MSCASFCHFEACLACCNRSSCLGKRPRITKQIPVTQGHFAVYLWYLGGFAVAIKKSDFEESTGWAKLAECALLVQVEIRSVPISDLSMDLCLKWLGKL